MDPRSSLLMWSLTMNSQAERSRMAEKQHLAAEQVRQSASAGPTLASKVGRAWRAFARIPRPSAEPAAVATQP